MTGSTDVGQHLYRRREHLFGTCSPVSATLGNDSKRPWIHAPLGAFWTGQFDGGDCIQSQFKCVALNRDEIFLADTFRLAYQTQLSISGYNVTIPTAQLDEASFVDLTSLVEHGTLTWTAPSGDSDWRLFTFWERYTNQRSNIGGTNATTVIGNGSWTVDHFSSTGAQVTTDFWDHTILSDTQTADLVREAGHYGLYCDLNGMTSITD